MITYNNIINRFYQKPSRENVETKPFESPSHFSLCLRAILKPIILSFSDKKYREDYATQFDLASRNVEITIETLMKLFLFHPVKNAFVLNTVGNWLHTYFKVQFETKNFEKYYVYTQHDNQIPFYPEEDIMYTYMISQISYVANELAKIFTAKEMNYLASCFVELNNFATYTHNKYQTLMPRFANHNRLTLKVIQHIDKPYNCCPSLHIAYTLLLDNVIEKFFYTNTHKQSKKKTQTFESIRYSSIRMFNSVLYTKQHSILDVAFGMLCSHIVFEKKYKQKFNNLIYIFDDLKKDNPYINYEVIKEIYVEGMELYEKKISFYKQSHEYTNFEHLSLEGISFRETVGDYLIQYGYPKLPIWHIINEGVYFDTVKRNLVG
ncbi:MAG: hypothetical protein HQK79_16600 [Desulfobacterales bacterium]|nr:hypothetical protein [Desulfobacterales bacterium]MBF0397274.1 hypothetical protein [Desulfobacterales bacterium]